MTGPHPRHPSHYPSHGIAHMPATTTLIIEFLEAVSAARKGRRLD